MNKKVCTLFLLFACFYAATGYAMDEDTDTESPRKKACRFLIYIGNTTITRVYKNLEQINNLSTSSGIRPNTKNIYPKIIDTYKRALSTNEGTLTLNPL